MHIRLQARHPVIVSYSLTHFHWNDASDVSGNLRWAKLMPEHYKLWIHCVHYLDFVTWSIFFLELDFTCCHYLRHKEYLQCNIDTQFTNLWNLSLFLPVYLASHKAKDLHLVDFEKQGKKEKLSMSWRQAGGVRCAAPLILSLGARGSKWPSSLQLLLPGKERLILNWIRWWVS